MLSETSGICVCGKPWWGHWTVEVAIISHGTQTSPMPPKLADGTRYNFPILVFQENNSGDKSREVEWGKWTNLNPNS